MTCITAPASAFDVGSVRSARATPVDNATPLGGVRWTCSVTA
jgi:hypothetical protein